MFQLRICTESARELSAGRYSACLIGPGVHWVGLGICCWLDTPWRMNRLGEWSLRRFGIAISLIDGEHPLFSSGIDTAATIPFMIHGDEGRGRNKLPLLTISFQGILSHYGSHRLNMSGFRSCITNKLNFRLIYFVAFAVLSEAFILQPNAVCLLPITVLRRGRCKHLRTTA